MTLLEALREQFPDSSNTTLRQMLKNGRVTVNGEVENDAKIVIEPDDLLEVGRKPAHRDLPPGVLVLHEDNDVIVVLKPNGLLTVPTEREKESTLQAALNKTMSSSGKQRIHVVHRLDRETSGVLVFAKNFPAREALKEQFAEHSTDRLYVAIVEGTLDPRSGTFRSHLFEGRDLRMRSVTPRPESKLAITHYRTLAAAGEWSMLEVRLETGRKNQIRVHLSEAGHPVAGDLFYGAKTNPLGRLGLHAKLLGFTHPTPGERLTFNAPTPRAFRRLFDHA